MVSRFPSVFGLFSIFLLVFSATRPAISQGEEAPSNWFVSPQFADKLIKEGAMLLDARDKSVYDKGHFPQAISVLWEESSQPNLPYKGNLLPVAQLEAYFQSKGVFNEKTVLVIGDPQGGWGEEGRVAWTLRTLGHKKTFLVDGGFPALLQLGWKVTKEIPKTPKGDFRAKRDPQWEIDHREVKSILNKKNYVIIDTREPREYAGETPYGESRAGHIPGAKAIYYKDLLTKDGKLLEKTIMTEKLKNLGVDEKTTVVSYCTGGVRSAWFTSALVSRGYIAKNYAGSTWEWASLPPTEYPLVK